MKKKVAALGGSFNPIQYGQLAMTEYMLENSDVDEVLLIPCYKHSFDKELEKYKHRYKMIELAAERRKGIGVSDIERKMYEAGHEKSYTLDTVRELKKDENIELAGWIIGADILGELHKWHEWEKLIEETSLLVFKRTGYNIESLPKNSRYFDFEPPNISSTKIRNRIKNNESIDDLVPEEVAKYMNEKKLYKN